MHTYGRHAYERRAYEMAAYERHVYGRASRKAGLGKWVAGSLLAIYLTEN
jgi:hypothetical protein